MINHIKTIFTSVFTSFKTEINELTYLEKIELKNKIELHNLKNISYLNITIVIITLVLLVIDFVVIIDKSIQAFPSHKFIFAIHLFTIPSLMFFNGIIYYYNFKNFNKASKHFKALLISNLLVIILIASYYNFFELKDFDFGSTLFLIMIIIAIMIRVSIKKELLIATIFIITYFSSLQILNFNFEDNPLVYLNGIALFFFYMFLATIISKQTQKIFINRIILKKKNNELSIINEELSKSQKQVEVQNTLLKESNAKLTKFAFMAAHDLKGPLRTTKSLLEILYSKYNMSFEEEDKPLLKHVMKSSKDLSNLISNLLLFSSLTLKLPEVEEIDINMTIMNVQDSLQYHIEKNNIEFDISDEMHNVKANPNLVYQLFQNIIANSIKFSKDSSNKKIIIRSKKLNTDFIQFSIQDFGIGIPINKQDSVFDLFYRVHSTEKYSGSGMGLSICKEIIEYYKGEIWFESLPDVGTTFYFTLSKV